MFTNDLLVSTIEVSGLVIIDPVDSLDPVDPLGVIKSFILCGIESFIRCNKDSFACSSLLSDAGRSISSDNIEPSA